MKMKINSKDFRVREGDKVNLKKWPTLVDPAYKSKDQYKKPLGEHVAELSSQQQLLYASNRHAVLLIFQAMDAAGKDGAIKHVMSGVNPQGCQVFSFKHPSAGELQHDFLWRTTRDLPERGRIGIFNRSYYEEVLIARVHPEILLGEGIPDAPHDDKTVWHGRYRSIVDLERHLHANGTRIIKFFLHLSEEEQRKRFLARIDEPEKNWKFSNADIEEQRDGKKESQDRHHNQACRPSGKRSSTSSHDLHPDNVLTVTCTLQISSSLKCQSSASRPIHSDCRVKVLEFDTGILGGELPIGLGVVGIAVVLPCGDFLDEG